MSRYADEVAPDVVSPYDMRKDVPQPIKHLDTVLALYDFPGTQPSHLSLNLGDTIYVLSKSDTGWWDGVVIGQSGDITRGWFPHTYVRSVNYFQPALNRLKNSKEIDNLTAANTAANVLIPSFSNMAPKNPGDSDRNSPANSTRKNSVVSFASSDGSLPSESKPPTFSSSSQGPSHQGSTSFQHGIHDNSATYQMVDAKEAESQTQKYQERNGTIVMWVSRFAPDGDLIYYCDELNLSCSSMPMVKYNKSMLNNPIKSPTESTFSATPMLSLDRRENEPTNNSNASGSVNFDPLKRGSTSSGHTQNSNTSSSYHNFKQPLFNMDGLFYQQASDLTKWTELGEQFVFLLELSLKALKEFNKQMFSAHFAKLNKLIILLFGSSRLTREDYKGTKYESSIRRKLKRIATSFSQFYIDGILYLNYMHYSSNTADEMLFDFDISKLNKSTSISTANQSISSSISTITPDVLEGLSKGIQRTSLTGEETYLQLITYESESIKVNVSALIKIFLKLSKDKKVKKSDYNGSDVSEDEGEERYNHLPQLYPRFVADDFNGGNWCNPFFRSTTSILNASGDELKNRYHSKIIIDQQAFNGIKQINDEITKLSNETLRYLDPEIQNLYYNEALKSERNSLILRLIYKYLYHISSMIDIIESFDFTVFCLTKRSGQDDDTGEVADQLKVETDIYSSNLTFDYPIVLEFFKTKQELHDLVANVIMVTQSLTSEDPEVFKGMKDDDPLFYKKDIAKDSTEKAAILLTSILVKQRNQEGNGSISMNQDSLLSKYISDGISLFENTLRFVRQLIEERETIINYATRVMHNDFNVQLLMIERNNTIASDKHEDISSFYGGQKKSTDTPWYLEGDDEFDLLLDIKGAIKGGTKEALVSHLTHHETYDGSFNSVFLLTFPTIFSFNDLCGLLINRFNIEAPEGLSFEEYNTWISKKQTVIRVRVLEVMRQLFERYWTDSYYDEGVMKRLQQFLSSPNVNALNEGKYMNSLITKVLNGEKVSIEKEPQLPNTRPPAPLVKGFTVKKTKLLDIDYVELARQLTIRESKLYLKINSAACLTKVWGKKSGIKESVDSITEFISASNQLTNFVAYMILRKPDHKKRVQIIRYFVQVAEKCRQYNNYSSMTAIISALYSSPIHRLKRTWKYVHSDTLSLLQSMNKLMNSSRNFNEYRDVLKFVGSEPCIPFFGVYLSDLTFIFHGNPDTLMNRTRLINFAKRTKTYEIIQEVERFKDIAYNFQEVGDIQKYLDSWLAKCPPIEEQYHISLTLEPRKNTTEQNPTNTASLGNSTSSSSAPNTQTANNTVTTGSTSSTSNAQIQKPYKASFAALAYKS